MKKEIYIFSLIVIIAFLACGAGLLATEDQNTNTTEENSENIEKSDWRIKYNLKTPESVFALDEELIEISGLSYDSRSKSLLAVNDEKAHIYKLKASDCSIVKEYDFGKKGDYEGIEIIGEYVYVLKSNGNIYRTTMREDEDTQEFKSELSSTNDVEGLAYNPMANELILACKGKAALEDKDKLKATKAFYSFDLDKMDIDSKPAFTITDDALFSHYEKMPSEKKSVSSDKKLKNRLKSFSPSAIAWHPIDKYYYILSSVGKLLVVTDTAGGLIGIEFLDDDIHGQPEGICFSPDGAMFISNEGRGLVAKVLKFNYQ